MIAWQTTKRSNDDATSDTLAEVFGDASDGCSVACSYFFSSRRERRRSRTRFRLVSLKCQRCSRRKILLMKASVFAFPRQHGLPDLLIRPASGPMRVNACVHVRLPAATRNLSTASLHSLSNSLQF